MTLCPFSVLTPFLFRSGERAVAELAGRPPRQGIDRSTPWLCRGPYTRRRSSARPTGPAGSASRPKRPSILSEVKIPEQADQAGEDAARIGTVEGVHLLAHFLAGVVAHQRLWWRRGESNPHAVLRHCKLLILQTY